MDDLQASGRYTFRKEEACRALHASPPAFRKAAWRLLGKTRLAMPRRGFFVVVPTEYRTAGAPPPSWFIDDLMRFHGHPYYVGVLSAAALHGAAHHQPQEFQVVSDVPFRSIRCGRARIRFFTKKHLSGAAIIQIQTPTGMMRVSSPEVTALDLVRYVRGAGGLGNAATLLSELKEKLRPEALVEVAGAEPAPVQRLGYLLDLVGAKEQAKTLGDWISRRHPSPVPLSPGKPVRDAVLRAPWRVLVNEQVEAET